MENKFLYDKLTILIVLFNEDSEIILKTLEKIIPFKKIIIDNANNRELKKEIESKYKIDKYVLNKKNNGFSAGYNQAIKLCETEFSLILNPDCIIDIQDINLLLNSISKYDKCFLTAPLSYDKNNNLTHSAGPFKEKFEGEKGVLNISGDTCVETALGACMFVRTKSFIDIGLFDETFFLYFSDDDLCRRIKNIGNSIILVSEASCVHEHGIIKVKNKLLKIIIREFHFTFDSLYYHHKVKSSIYYEKIKKKNFSYLKKLFVKIFTLQIFDVVKLISRIAAFLIFSIKYKWRGGRAV